MTGAPSRSLRRILGVAATAIVAVTCTDLPGRSSLTTPDGDATTAAVSLVPVFSSEAARTATQLADFDIPFDRVHITLAHQPIPGVVVDTTIPFGPTSPDLTLLLSVPVLGGNRQFDATIEYRSGTTVLFAGEAQVVSHGTNDRGVTATPVAVRYVGPGANAARVTVSPKSLNLLSTKPFSFTASAVDKDGNAVAAPIAWTVSDPNLASISGKGATITLTPTGKTGAITLTARTPTGISDQAATTLATPVSQIVLLSGGGQTRTVGTVLPTAVVVEARGPDAAPLAGVPLTFAVPTGGSANPASATTDASGRVTTTLTLGTAVGAQTFVALSSEGPTSTVAETATADVAKAVATGSGDNQSQVIHLPLKQPLVASVVDRFGNPVSGVTVTWSTTGTGGPSAPSSITNAAGEATVTYTVGGVVGTEIVSATVANIGKADFTVHATASTPSGIVALSGGGQSVPPNSPLTEPLVVVVTDPDGNPVAGAGVTWSGTNFTTFTNSHTTTDADGKTSVIPTLGAIFGPTTITATLDANGKTTTFIVSVAGGGGGGGGPPGGGGGPPALGSLTFSAQPTGATAGIAISPAIVVSIMDPSNKLLTSATNAVTLSLGQNPANAKLGGTLTRNAVAGVATFNDVAVDRAGTFTLVATATSFTSSQSDRFTIVGPAKYVVTTSASSVVAGAAVTVTAQAVDASNNALAAAGLPVTWTRTGAGGSFASSTSLTDAHGVASIVFTTSTTAGVTYAFTATDASSATGSSSNVVTAAGPAAKYVVTPSMVSVVAGDAVTISAQLADAYGNAVSAAGSVVNWSANVNGGSFAAPTSSTNSSGVATVSFTTGTIAGVVYTLSGTDASNRTGSTAPITTIAGVPAKYIVSASNSHPLAGSTVTITAQLADKYDNSSSIAGRVVTWSSTSGGTFSTPTSTTNTSGVATVQFTAGTTATTVIASTDPIQGQTPITPTAPGVQATKYIVTTSATSIAAGGAVTVTAQLADASGNPVSTPGVTVTWSRTGANGAFASPTSSTNASGAASVQFTTGTAAGITYTFTATDAAALTGTSGNVVTVAGPAAKYFVTASSFTPPAGSSVTITAQLVDVNNNPVNSANQPVSWTSTNGGSFAPSASSPTNASGVATVSFVTSSTSGTTHVVTATTGSVTGASASITTTPVVTPARYVVTSSNGSPAAGATVTISAQVVDAGGNAIALPGQTVTWSSTNGGSFASSSTTTNASGIATVAFTTSTVVGTSHTITAATGSVTGSTTVTTVPGPAAKYIVTTSASSVVAGAPVTITARLVDASGNPISLPGVLVTWSNTGAGGSFATPTSSTDANGVATVSFTTNTVANVTYTFTATDASSRTGTSGNVTTVAGPAAKYLVSTSSTSPVAGTAVTITAQLADVNNNVVSLAGQTVTWTSTNGGSFTPSTSTTNTSGVATTSFTTSPTPNTAHVVTAATASITGSSPTITTTPAPAAGTKYIVTTNVPSVAAGGAVAVSAQLVDQTNAPVATPGVTVTWTHTGAGGSFATATSLTDASGLATVAFTTSITAGATYTFTATDAQARTGTSGNVVTVAGAAAKYLVTTSNSSPLAGTSITATAQLADVNNNVVRTAGQSVTWTSTNGGSFTPPTSSTDANGVATVSFTTSTQAGTTHVITATTGSLTGSASPIQTVAPTASVARYVVASSNPTPVVGTQVTISAQAVDASGNPVAAPGMVVNWTSSGGGSLGASSSTTSAAGVATVTFNVPASAGTTTTITATTGSVTGSTSVTSVADAGTKYRVTTTATLPLTVGGSATLSAQLTDAVGNAVAKAGLVVTWATTNGGSFSSGTSTTDANGIATIVFTASTVAGVTHQISATTGTITGSISVSTQAGAAVSLVFTQQPTASAAGSLMATVTVTLRDAFNNVATGSTKAVSLAIASGPSGAALLGGGPVTPVNGVATFSSLSVTPAGTYTLSASATGLTPATSTSFVVVP